MNSKLDNRNKLVAVIVTVINFIPWIFALMIMRLVLKDDQKL